MFHPKPPVAVNIPLWLTPEPRHAVLATENIGLPGERILVRRGLRVDVHAANRIAHWLVRVAAVIMHCVSRCPVVHRTTSLASLVSLKYQACRLNLSRQAFHPVVGVGSTAYRAASTFSIAMPLRPAFSITLPETLTFVSMNSISLVFGFL